MSEISEFNILSMTCKKCCKKYDLRVIEKHKCCPNCKCGVFDTKIEYTLKF